MRAAPYRSDATREWLFRAILLATYALGACGTSANRRWTGPPWNPAAGPHGEVSVGARQEGLASYYSNRLAGRRTASGDIYRPQEMTAAHRTLPFGTQVRVTRLDDDGNFKTASVVVQINDRGPFSGQRILDLSYAAARALGMLRAGVVRVEIMVLGTNKLISDSSQ